MSNVPSSTPIDFKYICVKCNYYSNDRSAFKRHELTKSHVGFGVITTQEEKEKTAAIRSKRGRDAISTGNETEAYIIQLLQGLTIVEKVINCGHTGSTFDVMVQLIGESDMRGIQIKTLTQGNKRFLINGHYNKYHPDLLILGVNQPKTHYVALYFKEITSESGTVNFCQNGQYGKYLYDNLNTFETDLIVKLRSAIVVDSEMYRLSMNLKQLQECESIERITKRCKVEKLDFEPKITNSDEIDFKIQGLNCQLKTSTCRKSNLFQFNLMHTRKQKPYSVDDNVDIFVFEIATLEYQNYFYIIPKATLIKRGFIHDKIQPGKTGIYLPTPNTDFSNVAISHWSVKYLNTFHIFNTYPEISFLIPNLSMLEQKALELKLDLTSHVAENGSECVGWINNIPVKYIGVARPSNKHSLRLTINLGFQHREIKFYIAQVNISHKESNFYIIPATIIEEKSSHSKNDQVNITVAKEPRLGDEFFGYLNNFQVFIV
jgi:hypothetical protein